MNRQIAADRELDTGIQNNRRCFSWNSKLRSTKSKPEAVPLASAQKSSVHCIPKLVSGKIAEKQPRAGSMRGASWGVLEAELDARTNGAWKDLNVSISTIWEEPEELERPMNGSVKHLNTPNSALWDELEAEIARRMAGLLKEVKEPRSIATDEEEQPVSSKKGEFQSSFMKAAKQWRLRSLNLAKAALESASTDKKGIKLPTEIGTSSGNTTIASKKPATNNSHPSKEESWLQQQTIKNRDRTWLEQARIAIDEAKRNAKSREQFENCISSLTSGSETSETESDCSDTESVCSDTESDCSDTGIDDLFGWLGEFWVTRPSMFQSVSHIPSEIMIETERYMSLWDNPRGMIVGGKRGMYAGEFWVARPSMFQTVSHIPS
jgi:hypothetical protein